MNDRVDNQKRKVYYLPGRGGELLKGLGEGLISRGCEVSGRETRDDFARLDFADQVRQIQQDIKEEFAGVEAKLVANSYGAYLLLNALASLPPLQGSVLLLSPILGDSTSESQRTAFSPPRANFIRSLVDKGAFPVPAKCEIHVGSEDWQSDPDKAREFAKKLNISLKIVEGRGHVLGKDYVGPLLESWLTNPNCKKI